jgi:hypothetical protein
MVELRAGQAVVFDNRTLHASPPNTTAQTRVAFGIGITHREATLRHYYLLPRSESPMVEGYEVHPDFFLTYNNARLAALYERGQKPAGLNSIGVFALRPRQYETAQLVAAIEAAGNTADASLRQRAAGLFDATGGAAMAGAMRAAPTPASADNRPFWKIYTPGNIVREINYRLRKHLGA